MTVATCVCCSITSLIQMRYGSRHWRQGRSRAWRTNQARKRRRRAPWSTGSVKSASTLALAVFVEDGLGGLLRGTGRVLGGSLLLFAAGRRGAFGRRLLLVGWHRRHHAERQV